MTIILKEDSAIHRSLRSYFITRKNMLPSKLNFNSRKAYSLELLGAYFILYMFFFTLGTPYQEANPTPDVLNSVEVSLNCISQIQFIDKFEKPEERIEAFLRVLSLYTHVDYKILQINLVETYKGNNLELYLKDILLKVMSDKDGVELFQQWQVVRRQQHLYDERSALLYAAIAVSIVVVIRELLLLYR